VVVTTDVAVTVHLCRCLLTIWSSVSGSVSNSQHQPLLVHYSCFSLDESISQSDWSTPHSISQTQRVWESSL